MNKTTAAVTHSCGADWVLSTVEVDEPRANEVLVRIVATGLCHTDVSVRDQQLPVPLPAVLGHEGAGIVEKVGADVTELKPGDHVVLSVTSCGKCPNCLRGLPSYCQSIMPLNFSGRRPDGSSTIRQNGAHVSGCFFGQSSFAGFAIATERNAIKVPKDIPLDILGPLGCGIQTGAGTVINTLKAQVGSSIAIFGAGAVGLSAVMAAKVTGCTTIVAVDIHENRLALAKELGATHVLNSKQCDAVSEIRKLGGGVDYSIDTTAVGSVIRQAVECLGMPGRCVIVGVSAPGAEITLSVDSIFFGKSIGGAIEGDSVPRIFIPQLIDLWRQGRFPFDRLVRFYDLAEINQAAADSASGVTLKPILRIAHA
jgi:aryl-alcohol dehydrogenase